VLLLLLLLPLLLRVLLQRRGGVVGREIVTEESVSGALAKRNPSYVLNKDSVLRLQQ